MRLLHISVFLFLLLILMSCQTQPMCPPSNSTPQRLSPSELESSSFPALEYSTKPVEVEINGKTMKVDKLVEGVLCNDTWRGTVYVGCDVRVFEWEEEPLFLKGCDLSIEPGTVVYVAAHNDAAYYNGCACHTGEGP